MTRISAAALLCTLAGCMQASPGEAAPDAGAATDAEPEPEVREVTTVVGSDDVIDTYIRSSEPALNFGADPRLCAETDVDERRVLLRFDLAAVTAATVTEATFHLSTTDGSVDSSLDSYLLYEVLEPWHEGGLAGEEGAASWAFAQTDTFWAAPGAGPGSRGAVPIGSFVPATRGANNAVAIDPDVVNRWVADPTTNHGMLIVDGGVDATCFHSSEAEVAAQRPAMTLVWTE